MKKEFWLKSIDNAPPGGFTCTVPETGAKFKGSVFYDVVTDVAEHLVANGYSPDDSHQRVEEHTALRLYDNHHRLWVADGSIGMMGFLKGTMAYAGALKAKATGSPVTCEARETQERLEICSTCPCRHDPQRNPNPLERAARKRMRALVGLSDLKSRETGICGLCGCDLATIARMAPDIVAAPMSRSDFAKLPSACWKNEFSDKKDPENSVF